MTYQFSDFISDDALARVNGKSGLHSRLPRVAYTDPGFQRLEYERWLDKTWLFVGRGAAMPNPGDRITVPGHPYILVRNASGAINCFQNACRHRGVRLMDGGCQSGKTIVCPYHHWTYDLDGRLLGAPHFGGYNVQDAPGFDKADRGLKPVRCAQWHDWIFINVDGKAPPIEEFVAPLAAKFPGVAFDKADHYLTIDLGQVDANWKIATENNAEPYHVPFVHKDTAAGQPLDGHYMVDDGPVLGCAVDVPGSTYTNKPGDNSLTNLDMSARYLLRTPNFFLTSYAPDKIIDSLILPDRRDPTKCWIQTAWYSTSGHPLTEREVETWRDLEQRVADEDSSIMAAAQDGLLCDVMDDGGALSPAWEACLIAFYRELTTALRK
ncbi:MAG: aromatic ring-hydroxylating dioxygenase subunit alpha [Rhodospirillales bacterium]